MDHEHGHHHHADDVDHAAMAEMLELDAQVLGSYVADVMAKVVGRAADTGLAVRRILDLGCGTGTGTLALAERFSDAEVVAVDQSGEMLARLEGKVRQAGLADRVRIVSADLDEAWPATGTVDLAWTSMALHHFADPDRVLADIFAAIRPGGLLAVAEMSAPIRFLPDDLDPGLGRPGLEARCQAALAGHAAVSMPHLGADWGPSLDRAGFCAVGRDDFELERRPSLPAAAGVYAQLSLRHTAYRLRDQLEADDLAVLDVLTSDEGPASVLRRQDLVIRGARTLWIAERP